MDVFLKNVSWGLPPPGTHCKGPTEASWCGASPKPKSEKHNSILVKKYQEEKGIKTDNSNFSKKLLQNFESKDLHGKSIKDKRGGKNNIHSWNIGIKGKISKKQDLRKNK